MSISLFKTGVISVFRFGKTLFHSLCSEDDSNMTVFLAVVARGLVPSLSDRLLPTNSDLVLVPASSEGNADVPRVLEPVQVLDGLFESVAVE